MGKQQKAKPQRQHLSRIGIGPATDKRYRSQLLSFFRWLSVQNFALPSSVPEIDLLASEYVNHMWQEHEPFGYAGDLISGLIEYVPATKRGLPVTRQYHANWKRTIRRQRAIPLTPKFLKALLGGMHCLQQGLFRSFAGRWIRWVATHHRNLNPVTPANFIPSAAVESIHCAR